MKFDEVIGNPPYDKDLHLKILAAITEVCDFETGGVISWLAPVGWLQEKMSLEGKRKLQEVFIHKRFK